MGDSLVYVRSFLAKQFSLGRYRVVFLHGPAQSGKTRFAKTLARELGAEYLNLLVEFLSDASLVEQIDRFSPGDLVDHCLTNAASDIIVVDDLDFLINTWTDDSKREFLSLVETLSVGQTNKLIFFVAQTDSGITLNHDPKSRVLRSVVKKSSSKQWFCPLDVEVSR